MISPIHYGSPAARATPPAQIRPPPVSRRQLRRRDALHNCCANVLREGGFPSGAWQRARAVVITINAACPLIRWPTAEKTPTSSILSRAGGASVATPLLAAQQVHAPSVPTSSSSTKRSPPRATCAAFLDSACRD